MDFIRTVGLMPPQNFLSRRKTMISSLLFLFLSFSIPSIIPVLMQSNISPQFTQFVMRAVDSMTNGITPLYAYFVIYIGYLNIYNIREDKPISISNGIKIMFPYFAIISITWLLIVVGWYIIGLPIGPGVYPTI